ncbi:4Fe-4S binding protein [Croceivirga thetidis]|uniref:4Fe-4S binding protein n=1 Tax=Croceivirga thetidis TaxID=2721623 RepID=A0ABX1GUT4_9FLAO|nr:4Fe-4S binding protein [Croceivirga thetidis]NKI32755.1 4Fe-4S binding protein [Croceivirga thetidis]
MKKQSQIQVCANEAVARIAYKTNEIFPIYPITPASPMSSWVEEWSAKGQKNIFGSIPRAFEMQSEAGVAGTMHGALQTGSLSSTFTASQGLLLMLPNMYKIAGELTPNVIHVATRSIATHALSIFGDHSDIMAVRASGYAFLASASVQEAMDFALISQLATLKSKIPFVHFFDGFRTSHETQKINEVSDDIILKLMDDEAVKAHRRNALDPNNPVIRGTSQAADTFFQSREAINSLYESCPDVVQETMDEFADLTGRHYKIIDYFGHPDAEHVLISMASSTETIEETVRFLNGKGEKCGLIKIRLYRPLSIPNLLCALPKSCKNIAVLDRTKEAGSVGEPLFLEINQALVTAYHNKEISYLPMVIGGRYGLSSKELTPGMVVSIFENLKNEHPKPRFTVGINDDVSNLSLPVMANPNLLKGSFQMLCYGQDEGFNQAYETFLNDLTLAQPSFLQSYTEIDYKKSKSDTVHNLRLSETGIKAPYLIQEADLLICANAAYLNNQSIFKRIKTNGTLILSNALGLENIWANLELEIRDFIRTKRICLYAFNGEEDQLFKLLLKMNPFSTNGEFITTTNELTSIPTLDKQFEYRLDSESNFTNTFLGHLLDKRGNELPVSAFPIDGTFPTNTSELLGNRGKGKIPIWDMDSCTQCGLCSLACPQAAIRPKVISNEQMPLKKGFKSLNANQLGEGFDLLNYTIQVNPDQCTSCNNCVESCTVGALQMSSSKSAIAMAQEHWSIFENIQEYDRCQIDDYSIPQQQLQQPLFKYSTGEENCGQAPYLKLISQLFGDRMLIANATGASSIFGGALPVTPWSKNKEGFGPAWSNSLFEDNAEFGMGFQLSQRMKFKEARTLLANMNCSINGSLISDILECQQLSEQEIFDQRNRVLQLKKILRTFEDTNSKQLLELADFLVKRSVWIIGGDGWAYDIGYGGVDHVLASGENVNILVLDNELYSNTGGQKSKATPKGASAKFGFQPKAKNKKDLGALAMQYDDVYVASIAIGADAQQTLTAFKEAESFEGPSLIIAYCSSKEHGIDSKSTWKHQAAAVKSGHWKLYRYDPRLGEDFLTRYQLDSVRPSMPIKDFYAMEKRFHKYLNEQTEFVSETKNECNLDYYNC